MRVYLTRRGGLAGVALHAALDTAQLCAVEATRAEAALRDLPWGRLPAAPPGAAPPGAAPPGADRFRYEVRTAEGGHQRHVELGETEIPDALRPLIELLANQGHLRPASG
ncbi:MAG: hypothetical protein JO115_04015 [Pseudonocardiales bacterium]|nr:hypothetical protein [Pseudonocardiales bacterium]